MRARRWVALGVVGAGLVLTGCGTTPVAGTLLTGTPSINISVPLSIGACDGEGTCYAFGTTDFSATPTDAGQMAVRNGGWVAIPTPSAPNAELTLMACWHGGCLVVGYDDSGNFAWRVHGSSVVPATTPRGTNTPVAVTCFASATCGLVTVAAGGVEDYSLTSDGGTTWDAPVPVPLGGGDHALAVSCSGPRVCVLTGASAGPHARAFTMASVDGGGHWSAPRVSAQWKSIDDLYCSPAACVALANAPGSRIEVTADARGRHWTPEKRQPGGTTNTLACGSVTNCLATTESLSENPGVDRGVAGRWQPYSTIYLPDGVADVACSALRCVLVDGSDTAIIAP